MKNHLLTADDWSRYWEKGTITTFQGRFSDNYDGSIRTFWGSRIKLLPEKSNIIDLATGNGALALLAAQICSGRDISITAIDFAVCRPPKTGPFSQYAKDIKFVDRMPIEKTGFPSNSFDCAISQFGFEYADLKLATQEVDRILKDHNATFSAIIHNQSSQILIDAREAIKQIEFCNQSELIQTSTDLLKRLDVIDDPRNDRTCEMLRAKFNQIANVLITKSSEFRDASHIHFFLENISHIFKPNGSSLEEKLGLISYIEQESKAYTARMNDLLCAAKDEQEIMEIKKAFENNNFKTCLLDPFHHENELFSWIFIAER